MGVSARKIYTGGEEERERGGGKEVGSAARRLSSEGSGSGRVGGWRGKLVKFHAAPEHLKDNEFILRYYRASSWPLKQTLLSVFSIHNETLNIWTHLLGFFLFLGLTIYTTIKLPKVAESSLQQISRLQAMGWETFRDDLADMMVPRTKNPITRWPFFVFLIGAMFCLLSSSTCHLLMSHSRSLATFMLRVDYAGIASLIASSFYPPVYYTFMCTPMFRNIYLIGITVIGLATILVSLSPTFENVEYRPARAMLFCGMGLSGVIPCVHKLLIHWDEPVALKTFSLELAMGSLYGLGALIYTTRVPERWKPGRFDIAGHSHQIFHILVVAGAFTHYRASLLYLTWRDVQGCSV